MKAGLNLYSIRTLIKTEEEFTCTALKLKDMGYDFMQFSGCAYEPEKIKRVVDASGLPVVLTHVALDKILDEPEKLAEEHLSFGCNNIGLGTIPAAYTATEESWTETIDKLNIAAEKMKKVGCKFFFHHHHHEFFRLKSGKTVFEYMIENAPNFNFTVDSYWVQYGGYDPLTFVDKIKGRMDCVHLKDYEISRTPNAEGKIESKPHYAPVGKGSMNFPAIIEKWKETGAKYFLVEQDDACAYPDPLGQVKLSIDYLKTL